MGAEGLWNMRLWAAVNTIRSYSTFVRDRPDREKQLDDLGFVWDEFARQWEVVKEALATRKRLYCHMEVKQLLWCLKVPSGRQRCEG